MCNNMTTCHDPYRELELYLEKAQEEIVKAVKELEQHEEAEISNSSSSCENTSEILLPPPRAFLTLDYPKEKNYDYKRTNSVPQNTVTRVCHDGNLLDFKNSSPNCNTLSNHSSGRTSFLSSLKPGILGQNGNSTYSPNTRRRLWKMHPSISFPETSKDLLLLGNSAVSSSTECKPRSYSETSKDLDVTYSLKGQCNGKLSNENVEYSATDELFEKRRLIRNTRRRSNSETLSPFSQDEIDIPCMFPRPPSGDVNLLSIWANNLVLELDKSLSRELNSMDSLSPSSECSISPSKPDDSFGTNNFKNANFPSTHFQSSHYGESSRLSLPSKSLKPISMSPDSGIEPVSCETLEIFEDVDSFTVIKENDNVNYDLIAIDNDMDHITPPPPAFEDKKITESIAVCSTTEKLLSEKSHKTVTSEILNVANSVLETPDMTEYLTNNFESIGSRAYAVATETIELEDSPLVRTTCVINDVPIDVSSKEHSSSSKQQEHLEETLKQSKTDHNIFYSLPKPPKVIPNTIGKWCSSLPRDTGKNSDVICPQRSTSLYAVSCSNHVSIADLTAFIQNVKNGSYQPPSCADVSTDVKDDNENKDAVTQTTPVPLSRSSSFTWVTECDCSDWDLPNGNSGSEDSLLVADCSNCKSGSKNHNSSSSSLGISSDEDCEPLTPGSGGSSSLYLSACSGSSDSFDDANLAIEVPILRTDPVKPSEDNISQNTRRSLRNSESTLRGSALGDISEEQGTSETISVKSLTSNPFLTDSNAADNPEQSASFPSTLKVMKKNKSTGSPAQPIEPTVLVINELNLKSVSAPVLLRQKRHACIPNNKAQESSSSDSSPPTGARSKDSFCDAAQVPTRAHSAKELNELQAIEACTWLRAAGFPQYAQMYEDNQFPIDISIVQKDHAFLHPDSIQSLFRRLNTLNRCAKMKFVDHVPRKSLRVDESDDEEQYALSENWEFQRSSRRWSRIPSPSDGITDYVSNDPPSEPTTKLSGHLLPAPGRKYLSPEEAYCSSHDSVFIDEQHSSPDSIRRSSLLKPERISMSPSGHIGDCSPGSSSGSGGTLSLASDDVPERRSLRRSGSDRVKEGAKALLRRMESLKGKRKKKILDTNKMENVTTIHSGTDGSSSSSLTSSPQFLRSQKPTDGTCLSSQQSAKKVGGVNLPKGTEDTSAHSDSECHMFLISERWKDANSNDTKPVKQYITSQASVTITSTPDNLPLNPDTKEARHSGSLKLGAQKGNLLHPDYNTNQEYENFCDKRGSYYDNICAPLVVFNDLYAESLDRIPRQTNTCKSPQNQDDGDIIIINNERRDSGVGSSLTRGIATTHQTYPRQAQWHCFPHHYTSEIKSIPNPAHITDLTAPQMLLLRKLSLLKLTTVMEKFSPSSRTGWSWGVPKFIRRIRSPDYKDKVVFGVPLLLILQRTGQPLPVSIQAAIHFLRKTALDSTGLFRKSGVRSRIQKLKSMNETSPEKISYEEQQAYDVADMLKLYFRELPEALLTNKLSETFISIFQCIPEDLRLEAIQAALMLMPDENREVLQSLLEFLYEVCQHSGVNQMSATNLAVCFAPSLFHLSTARSASSSPRRRKTVGVPDLRELNENRAAYECLSCMVLNYKTLFTVSEETISQSRISSAIHFQPATVEELSSFSSNGQSGWKVYIDSCIQMFSKEVREKYKGWVNVSQNDHVELAYKKLSDGHPLRLWKVSTEVEAPPVELLNRILRERHLWDNTLVKWKVVTRFNKQTEIFQYLCSSLSPHPPCDYCVLRSWRTDLPKGTCVLIETSVNHPEAKIVPGSVRALVLASRYLIEPCGSGKSRITHLSRVDTRGRSPEWYNRAYGQICVLSLIRLRNSFSRSGADGPETKV